VPTYPEFREIGGVKYPVWTSYSGVKSAAMNCITEEPNDCCRCGTCCFATASTFDATWDFQSANIDCEDFDDIRSGSMTGIPTNGDPWCDDGEGGPPGSVFWSKTVGGITVIIQRTCGETPQWVLTVSKIGIISIETVGVTGDCCGATMTDVEIISLEACDPEANNTTGNSATITVQNNNCCLDELDECVVGTPNCDGTCDEGI
jgi:hypothetical protein